MPADDSKPNLVCPFCAHQTNYGLRVCTGCQASIVYGARDTDIAGAPFAYLFLLILLGFPSCSVVSFWGAHQGNERIGAGLATMFVLPLLIVFYLYNRKTKKLAGKVRFFRHQ